MAAGMYNWFVDGISVGSFATSMMQFLKEAVKAKNISAINKIISSGIN